VGAQRIDNKLLAFGEGVVADSLHHDQHGERLLGLQPAIHRDQNEVILNRDLRHTFQVKGCSCLSLRWVRISGFDKRF
jgi:hypothetical protein